jgi:hypothetical protein
LGNTKSPQQCGNTFHIILETAEGHRVIGNPRETSGMTVAIKSWLQGKERKSLRQDVEHHTDMCNQSREKQMQNNAYSELRS